VNAINNRKREHPCIRLTVKTEDKNGRFSITAVFLKLIKELIIIKMDII
jgi:hypothetical protein